MSILSFRERQCLFFWRWLVNSATIDEIILPFFSRKLPPFMVLWFYGLNFESEMSHINELHPDGFSCALKRWVASSYEHFSIVSTIMKKEFAQSSVPQFSRHFFEVKRRPRSVVICQYFCITLSTLPDRLLLSSIRISKVINRAAIDFFFDLNYLFWSFWCVFLQSSFLQFGRSIFRLCHSIHDGCFQWIAK